MSAARGCRSLACAQHTLAWLPRRGQSGLTFSSSPHPKWRLRRRELAKSSSHCASSSADTFTVTTPLYYANAAPHMGSAYPTIAADVIARYKRLRGLRVVFVTGTDEHGEKIALAAEKRGLTPKEHCDSIVSDYKQLWTQLDIAYDRFIRTTDAHHEQLVTQVLERVWESGDIYKDKYEGWYCVDCEEFKEEKEMDADHNCPTHRKACQFRSEENYFFRLSKWQKELEQLVIESKEFVQPTYRRNEVAGWVKEGAKDFSISRAAVQWGIPIQRDPKQTVYVWFDALNGYISALFPEGSSPNLDDVSTLGWPADLHIIGKDILRFHAVYWPGMLMSAGLPVPKKVYGHGFLTKDGLKMGKSLGNVLDPVALVSTYGADAVRYFFMKEISFGQDGNFSEAAFRETVNAGLANTIGNMLNRTLNLLAKFGGGTLHASAADVPLDNTIRGMAEARIAEAAELYDELQFHAAISSIVSVAIQGNVYLEQTAPWTGLKKGTAEEKEAAAMVLVVILELARIVAVALSPVTPALSEKILLQLGLSSEQIKALSWRDTAWGALPAGHQTAKPSPVFARIDATAPFVTEPAPAGGAGAAAK